MDLKHHALVRTEIIKALTLKEFISKVEAMQKEEEVEMLLFTAVYTQTKLLSPK